VNKCCGLASICCGLYLLKKLDIPTATPEASPMDVDDGAGVLPKGEAAGQQPAKRSRGKRGSAPKRKKAKKAKKAAAAAS
jgi:hypothetical protein